MSTVKVCYEDSNKLNFVSLQFSFISHSFLLTYFTHLLKEECCGPNAIWAI